MVVIDCRKNCDTISEMVTALFVFPYVLGCDSVRYAPFSCVSACYPSSINRQICQKLAGPGMHLTTSFLFDQLYCLNVVTSSLACVGQA